MDSRHFLKKSLDLKGGVKLQEQKSKDKEVQQSSWIKELRLKLLKRKQLKIKRREHNRVQKEWATKIKKLKMDQLDMKAVDEIVEIRMKPIMKESDISKYGNTQKLAYYRTLFKMETIQKICRKNGWTTRDDWSEHNVQMNKLAVELYAAARTFSEIRMYYDRLKFEQFARMHKG